MRYRYTVRNPYYLGCGDAESLEAAMRGVGFVVRRQGQFNPRQRFTWEILQEEDIPATEKTPGMICTSVQAQGTMTYKQAGGH